MSTETLDVIHPQTGEVLFRAERITRGRRTPQWSVIFTKMEKLNSLNIQEAGILQYLISEMGWGNVVGVGPFDVGRRFGMKRRTAAKHMRSMVKKGAIERLGTDSYRVSMDLAWKGNLRDWHRQRAELRA